MGRIFGDGRNALVETAEVFRVNADKSDQRGVAITQATLKQFAAEFKHERRGIFDRFIDGLNRLPRPMLALGTIGLFVAAMYDPVWFSDRMLGVTLIPEPLWWLMGAIVSFYFGARHQAKGQDFQRSVAQTLAVSAALRDTEEAPASTKVDPPIVRQPRKSPKLVEDVPMPSLARGAAKTDNAALDDWRAGRD